MPKKIIKRLKGCKLIRSEWQSRHKGLFKKRASLNDKEMEVLKAKTSTIQKYEDERIIR